MNVLLTGPSGYIGSAVARALVAGGHQVTGLLRDPARAPVHGAGFTVQQGDLTDPALLRRLASQHEGIIHAAMVGGPDGARIDGEAARALLRGAQEGGAQALVYTGGIWSLGPTGAQAAVEGFVGTAPFPGSAHRVALEQELFAAATPTLRTMVIRPGIVYGGIGGIIGDWIASALREHRVRVVGDGKNHWPVVHREDLAGLYRLVLERGRGGSPYHGTDDTTQTSGTFARAIAQAAGARVELWPHAEAKAVLGKYADALVLDQKILSPASRALGWRPTHPDLVAEASHLVEEARQALSRAPTPAR